MGRARHRPAPLGRSGVPISEPSGLFRITVHASGRGCRVVHRPDYRLGGGNENAVCGNLDARAALGLAYGSAGARLAPEKQPPPRSRWKSTSHQMTGREFVPATRSAEKAGGGGVLAPFRWRHVAFPMQAISLPVRRLPGSDDSRPSARVQTHFAAVRAALSGVADRDSAPEDSGPEALCRAGRMEGRPGKRARVLVEDVNKWELREGRRLRRHAGSRSRGDRDTAEMVVCREIVPREGDSGPFPATQRFGVRRWLPCGRFDSGARAAPLMARHESVPEGGACLVQAKRTRSLPSGRVWSTSWC